MTVNEYKETACATAGAVEEDMEVDSEPTLQAPVAQDSENLLGRVLAGKRNQQFNAYQSVFCNRGGYK